MKKILKRLRQNEGFSLVEAIVSVVIVGIAILPISMIFTTTVTRTVDTRKQLEANKLAEKYMETIKDKRFQQFNTIFHAGDGVSSHKSGTLTFTDGTASLSAMGIDPPPEGYEISIRYDNDTLYNAAVSTPTAASAAPDVDGIIEINSGSDPGIVYKNGDGSDWSTSTGTGNQRTIEITGERGTNDILIKHSDNNNLSIKTLKIDNPAHYALRFVMGSSGTKTITTKVIVNSTLTEKLKLYFYEGDDNTIDADVEVATGYVSVSRNLYLVAFNEPRITEIVVTVTDTTTGKQLANLASSKINE